MLSDSRMAPGCRSLQKREPAGHNFSSVGVLMVGHRYPGIDNSTIPLTELTLKFRTGIVLALG